MCEAYSWLNSLDLVVWEEGNIALSSHIVKEQHEAGPVCVAHFVGVAKRVDLKIEDKTIIHPPALALHNVGK